MSDDRRQPGRPREISFPYRLNLYVESTLVSDLARFARELSQKEGEPVSLAQALSTAIYESPRFRRLAPKKKGGKMPPSKLSAAIRRGAALHPQGQPHMYFRRDSKTKEVVGSTALGAAWAAAGEEPNRLTTQGLYARFPVLRTEKSAACPARGTCRTGATLDAHIIHLEDRHGWTRERVACWLEAQRL